MAKPGLHGFGEQPFERPVPTLSLRLSGTGGGRHGTEAAGRRLEFAGSGCERVDAGVRCEGLPAGNAIDAAGVEDRGTEGFEQVGRAVERGRRLVPFQQAELHVVLPAPLTGAKRLGELVDASRLPCQQPLHQRLGARLEKPRCGVAVEVHRDRIDVGLRQHLPRQHGRVDLEEAARVKHSADGSPHPAAEFENGANRHSRRAMVSPPQRPSTG